MSIHQGKTQSAAPRFGRLDADLAEVQSAIVRSREFLLSEQHPDGYWCGELEADSMLEADYIYLHTQLESGDPGRLQRALTEMMRYQNEDGSWSIYPGGPGNISLSVKCYSSAKLMGVEAGDPRLAKCRAWFWRMAAWSRATPSPRCISVDWASTTTTRCPRFRRRLFSFPAGSTSTSTRFLRGRGQFLFRWPSCTLKNRSRESRPDRESTSFLSRPRQLDPSPPQGPQLHPLLAQFFHYSG